MGKFVVRNGDLEGRKFRLEAGAKITLGRERADVNFFDKRMSRRHCALEVRDGVDVIIDLESTNGTWVNSQRVREARLQPGDLLRVGFTEIEFLGNPEPSLPFLPGGGMVANVSPNQTIAFRAKDILRPPSVEHRRRLQGKGRLQAARSAAMGKEEGARQYISAKGKFCEACGEAIFVKEGAPDEGGMVDGLYLCRMCALISEKQKQLGQDGLLPSYAKIVGGRMGATPAVPPPPVPAGGPMEIVEEEISLDDFIGAEAGAKAPGAADDAAGAAARASLRPAPPESEPAGLGGADAPAGVEPDAGGESVGPAEALAFLDEMLGRAAAPPADAVATGPPAPSEPALPDEAPPEGAAAGPAAVPQADRDAGDDAEEEPHEPPAPAAPGGKPSVVPQAGRDAGDDNEGEPLEPPAVPEGEPSAEPEPPGGPRPAGTEPLRGVPDGDAAGLDPLRLPDDLRFESEPAPAEASGPEGAAPGTPGGPDVSSDSEAVRADRPARAAASGPTGADVKEKAESASEGMQQEENEEGGTQA